MDLGPPGRSHVPRRLPSCAPGSFAASPLHPLAARRGIPRVACNRRLLIMMIRGLRANPIAKHSINMRRGPPNVLKPKEQKGEGAF